MILLKSTLTAIEILVQTILYRYFQSSYCIAFVSSESFRFDYNKTYVHIDPEGRNLTNDLLEVSEIGCLDYIVRVNEPKDFIEAFDKVVHLGNTRKSDRKIVFLPKSYNTDVIENLMEILSMKETTFITNVLIVVPSFNKSYESYDLITHKYIGPSNHNQPLYLDMWSSFTKQFYKNNNLFPHDMSDMYGKVVKVACFTYKPYVLLDINSSLVPFGRDGMEIRIIEEFCRWINCSVEIVRDDEYQWGEIYKNMTGVGVLGSLVEDRVDLGITALYSWYEEYLALDFSAPCIRTGITCIAPAPRLLASWETPFLPFTLYMWIAIFFTFMYASIALTFAQGGSTKNVFLTTFGMMITQSQSDVGRSWRIRSITGWLLMTGLVLDNAYGGGLASTFTVPKYEKSIDTIQDIVDKRMEWGATHDAWIFSLALSQEPLIRQLVNQFKTYSFEELERKSFSRSMAFSIEKLPAGYYAIGEYITEKAVLDFTIMLEDFYYEQCVVMLRKSSAYTNKMNELIGRLHESGLLLAWETQVALQHLNYQVQLEVKLSRSKKDVENIEPLALRHVLGVFILYGLGIIISSAIFILEIIIKKNME
ncbi:glutamate receptor 3.4-like [Papilio machaon]|uniref:glutamate receptor 3.4-like n=1 Tax=Papilio machaon TaxID=76193 RepID=UPI001E665948|nr:glutamate receptor 3.4-like [Papilio machaon]